MQSYRIRVGTFNVNGHLPSQDLSDWVRGHVERPAFIPPLKEVSPLPTDDIVRSPLEFVPGSSYCLHAHAAAASAHALSSPPSVESEQNKESDAASLDAQSSPFDKDTFHNISLDGETDADETAAPTPRADVPEDPADPDMLVLGFQELDLSTGALLYSSESTREDAWCMAVFAGLGEKAILYEKVRGSVPSQSRGGGTTPVDRSC